MKSEAWEMNEPLNVLKQERERERCRHPDRNEKQKPNV